MNGKNMHVDSKCRTKLMVLAMVSIVAVACGIGYLKQASAGHFERKHRALNIDQATGRAVYEECRFLIHSRFADLANASTLKPIAKADWGSAIRSLYPVTVGVGGQRVRIEISGGFEETIALEYVADTASHNPALDELWLRATSGDRLICSAIGK